MVWFNSAPSPHPGSACAVTISGAGNTLFLLFLLKPSPFLHGVCDPAFLMKSILSENKAQMPSLLHERGHQQSRHFLLCYQFFHVCKWISYTFILNSDLFTQIVREVRHVASLAVTYTRSTEEFPVGTEYQPLLDHSSNKFQFAASTA